MKDLQKCLMTELYIKVVKNEVSLKISWCINLFLFVIKLALVLFSATLIEGNSDNMHHFPA